jgi:hypothetical protein
VKRRYQERRGDNKRGKERGKERREEKWGGGEEVGGKRCEGEEVRRSEKTRCVSYVELKS